VVPLRAGAGGRLCAELDPFGTDGAGRIDPHPAAPVQPHLRPGVGIGLAHDEVIAERVEVAALIAGHDARRNSRRAHQERVGRGEMLAEAAMRFEQEVVDRITPEVGRRECIEEVFPEQVQRRARDRLVVAKVPPPLRRERASPRIEARRQHEVAFAFARAELRIEPIAQCGSPAIAQKLVDRFVRDQAHVGAAHGIVRRSQWDIERQQPAPVRWFQGDFVVDDLPGGLDRVARCASAMKRERVHTLPSKRVSTGPRQ